MIMCCRTSVICILIVVWTIVQSIFHLFWTITGYSFYFCHYIPSDYELVFFYLTYFFKDKCGKILMKPYDNIDSITDINSTTLHGFLKEILDKGVFPEESDQALRTQIYIVLFIITDGIWIISSVVLLVGNCYQIKNNQITIFYGPWLTITLFIIILDAIAGVHFGFDIRQIKNFTSWLKFVGIKNYEDFANFDEFSQVPNLVSKLPSMFICVLIIRFLIGWVLNILCFIYILNTVFSIQRNDASKSSTCAQNPTSVSREDRIRNWQLYYGSIENNFASCTNGFAPSCD